MRQSEHRTYFENLAANHKELGHVRDTHESFISVIQPRVNDPFSESLWLIEFQRKLQTGIKLPCLVMENYVWSYGDNEADQFIKRCVGAFIVLEEAKEDDTDDIYRALDRTERICDELLSYIKEDFHLKFRNHAFTLNSSEGENVGPVEQLYWGSRIDFVVTFSNKANLKFDPSKWNTPLTGYL